MRVSIVTPSFNLGDFIEETIVSVLNQSYSNLEYIVIDGGSNDRTPEILKKYEDRLFYWHSRKDRGFADAVNQGWSRSTGEILSFLNADDLLLEGTVEKIVTAFREHPEIDVVYGDARMIDAGGMYLYDFPSEAFDLAKIFSTWEDPIRQPSAFLRRRVFEEFGGLNETYHFCADFEYWIRISQHAKFLYLPGLHSAARVHPAAKSSTIQNIQADELIRICDTYISSDLFRETRVTPEQSRKALYYRTRWYYRVTGHYLRAAWNYFCYWWFAFRCSMKIAHASTENN